MTERFEAQVKKTPHAVALEFQGDEWTYRELHEKVDRLATLFAAARRDSRMNQLDCSSTDRLK